MPLIQINIPDRSKSASVKQEKQCKKKKSTEKIKKSPQFSKVWLSISLGISIFYTSLTYFFAWFGKDTVSDVTIAINELLWGNNAVAFIGYVGQNCVRAFTATKFGIETEKSEEKVQEEAKG